jgi:hypothetical protein
MEGADKRSIWESPLEISGSRITITDTNKQS